MTALLPSQMVQGTAVAAVVAATVFAGRGWRMWRRRDPGLGPALVVAVLWIAGLWPLAQLLSPLRLLSARPWPVDFDVLVRYGGIARSAGVVALLAVLAAGIAVWWRGEAVPGLPGTRRRPGPGDLAGLWLAALALSAAYLLSARFGDGPAADVFLPAALVLPAVVTMVVFLADGDTGRVLRHLHRISLVWIVGSLACWLAGPRWIQATLSYGPAPAVSFPDRTLRLQGLAFHPNVLGQIAAFGVLLAWWRRDTRLRPVWIGVGLTVLVLSGSRTSAAMLAVCALVAWRCRERRPTPARPAARTAALVLGPVAGAVALVAALRIAGKGLAMGATTLQGRSEVWALTIGEWSRAPVFGYGPDLWSDAYRRTHGLTRLPWAGHAHNEFIGALGLAGLVGFGALVLYGACLARAAWRGRVADRGLALTLVTGLLVTMLTESVLNVGEPVPALLPLLVLVAAVAASRARQGGPVALSSAPAIGRADPPVVRTPERLGA